MTKKPKPTPDQIKRAEEERLRQERQDRFAWTGDEPLFLIVDGEKIQSHHGKKLR